MVIFMKQIHWISNEKKHPFSKCTNCKHESQTQKKETCVKPTFRVTERAFSKSKIRQSNKKYELKIEIVPAAKVLFGPVLYVQVLRRNMNEQ